MTRWLYPCGCSRDAFSGGNITDRCSRHKTEHDLETANATVDALRADLERTRAVVSTWMDTADAINVEAASLRTQLASARADLREYGRHNEGCSGEFPPHRCKCGWAEVSAALASAGADGRDGGTG